MLAAIVASIWLLASVVAPLFEPILLAAALAMLTYPVLFEPIDRFLSRRLTKVEDETRRRIAGIGATAGLGATLVAPVVIFVVSSVGSFKEVWDLGLGVVMRNPERLDDLESRIDFEIQKLDRIYPKLNLDEAGIAEGVRNFLGEAMDMSGAFLSFIASGTGAVAQLALAIIALAFFYVEGPRVSRAILHYSPLREDQQRSLLKTHRATVLRLLNDTVANAVAKGIAMGAIVWAVNGFLLFEVRSLPLPFIAAAILAGVITLLPLVGVTVVWLPLAVGWWTAGEYLAAATVAIGCIVANFYIDRVRDRLSRSIDESSSWRSFLLFIGLVGGLLSFGIKGLIIGPMSVVLVSTVCSAWLPLYGGGSDDPEPPLPPDTYSDRV
jgi:predicted PurR-regulated permease PerM